MQRQLNERTEKLNIVGDSMERLEEQSSSFAGEVGKFVNQQRKKAILGGKLLSSFERI
jgi:syntaxin-binding protein 5